MVSLWITAAATVACSSGGDGGPELQSWVVASAPSTSVGEIEGDVAYLFQEIADASFTAGGRIVIADAGLSVIRIFDGDGSFLTQMGGDGDGPGEFRWLRDIWIMPLDTIGAWDPRLRRLTYFEPGGSFIRTVSLKPPTEAAGVGNLDLIVGPLSDGSIAIASLAFGSRDYTGIDRVSVERFAADGAHEGRLAETTGFLRVSLGENATAPAPFSPAPYFATHGDAVYHTNGRDPQVMVWSDGPPQVIDFPPTKHDPELAWAALSDSLEVQGTEFYMHLFPKAPRSDSIPHLAGLLVDNAGRIWTKRYDAATDALWLRAGVRIFGGTWWVADPDGALLATVTVPPFLAPIQVVGNQMLGLTVDSFGVERIQVHAIAR